MWQRYYQPTTLDEALALLREHAANARVVAGGTDVLVELSRGVRATDVLIDITKLSGLKYVRREGDVLRIGGLATHNDVVAAPECFAVALPLAQACWEIGAPQIRARATIAGNLVTASPANDTITPLLALGAEVVLMSTAGERVVSLAEFYAGFRRTVLRPDELVREIRVPALRPEQRGLFIKLGLRRAQAISVINLALVLTFAEEEPRTKNREPAAPQWFLGSRFSVLPIKEARIALGCLAPTVVRAATAEAFLVGRALSNDVCAEAGRLACDDVRPIDDVRGSAAYRLATLHNLLAEGLRRIATGRERDGWPQRVVRLETEDGRRTTDDKQPVVDGPSTALGGPSSVVSVSTRVNGVPAVLDPRKTLLDALREDGGLTGSKVGCAEGECGACTVWLDGQAVMACLVPAGQAHGAHVTTIEGLANDGLHPLQQTFIRHAAVQCGYCIPGMLMAGAKLLDELDAPSDDEIRVALSGNICRCTGYRKILDAVRAAATLRGRAGEGIALPELLPPAEDHHR
jgi:xanthine dehydrogenase iron-sulfur cluster and FAD-binding subunit A